MARIEIDGIYKNAPLTDAQISGTKRNLDREIIIKIDAVADRATLLPTVTDPTTDVNAYPSNYVGVLDYDSTEEGGDNPNIRRHIPTLELLASKGSADDNGGVQGTAGSSWINIETTAIGSYSALTGGQTLQAALESLDGAAAGAVLQHLIDGPEDGSLTSSIDGVTPSGTNSGSTYQINLGYLTQVVDSQYASVLGGSENYITNGNNSFIGGGDTNYIIQGSNYSALTCGMNNYIQGGSTLSFIGGGKSNLLDAVAAYSSIVCGESNVISGGADHSSIIGGFDHTITNSSTHSIIGGGHTNIITNSSPYSVIVGGQSIEIEYASHAFIGGGNLNKIHTNDSFIGGGNDNYIGVESQNSGICGGVTNYIGHSYSVFIGGGSGNEIRSSWDAVQSYSVIVGGNANYINDADSSFLGAGIGNRINTTGSYNLIVGGNGNYIEDSPSNSSIIGGNTNRIIGTSSYNFIGGGANNYIGTSSYSAILGGNNNIIDSTGNTFVLGSNITSDRIDATFIESLTLWDRTLDLRGETPNVGDVPIVVSKSGDLATLEWGNAGGIEGVIGLQYSGEVQYDANSWNDYLAINAWNDITTDGDVIGFDLNGYSTDLQDYHPLVAEIEATANGYALDVDSTYSVDISCAGRFTGYTNDNYSYRYSATMLIKGDGTDALPIEGGTISNQSYNTTSGPAPAIPQLNAVITTNGEELAFILGSLFRSNYSLLRPSTTYSTEAVTEKVLIDWPVDYPLAGTAPAGGWGEVYIWDGATSFLTSGDIESGVAGGVVKLNVTLPIVTNQPCYIFAITNFPVHKLQSTVIITKVSD